MIYEVTLCGQCRFYRKADGFGPVSCEHPEGDPDQARRTAIVVAGPDVLANDCPLRLGAHTTTHKITTRLKANHG